MPPATMPPNRTPFRNQKRLVNDANQAKRLLHTAAVEITRRQIGKFKDPLIRTLIEKRKWLGQSGVSSRYDRRKVSLFERKSTAVLKALIENTLTKHQYVEMQKWLKNNFPEWIQ